MDWATSTASSWVESSSVQTQTEPTVFGVNFMLERSVMCFFENVRPWHHTYATTLEPTGEIGSEESWREAQWK